MFYWRDGSNEVDFVLRKNNKVIAIEVKSNAANNTRGLQVFMDKFNPDSAFVVGDGGFTAEEFLSLDLKKLF